MTWGETDMMNCPKCGHAAHTRSSFRVSDNTKEDPVHDSV